MLGCSCGEWMVLVYMLFAVPIVCMESEDHLSHCYFCLINIMGIACKLKHYKTQLAFYNEFLQFYTIISGKCHIEDNNLDTSTNLEEDEE